MVDLCIENIGAGVENKTTFLASGHAWRKGMFLNARFYLNLCFLPFYHPPPVPALRYPESKNDATYN